MQLKSIKNLHSLQGKKVLLRIDSDVDIKNGVIVDDTRLRASLDSLSYLLNHKAIVILIGHLGRPRTMFTFSRGLHPRVEGAHIRGKPGLLDSELSLEPIAWWFARHLKGIVKKTDTFTLPGWIITPQVSMLENIRFFEGEEEPLTSSGREFLKALSSMGDIFVNDAFAVTHRAHASIVGIPEILPSYAGMHLEKEVRILGSVLDNPKRPLVIVIGGAKIETKLPMVEKMHDIADYVLVGGEIANQIKVLVKFQHEKSTSKRSLLLVADNKESGFDITEKSADNFAQVISIAETIVWNGPVGMTGHAEEHEMGTKKIAEAIASSKAYSIVGGGDTISFLTQHQMLSKFDFVSTGGGAMLELLSGKVLPGIKPLLK